jgi:hypothetical protein
MPLPVLAAALLAAAPAPVMIAQEPQLAADILVAGQSADAIARLERERALAPYDPAVLINLGIAYAQAGDENRAREHFKAAAGASQMVQVVTADGTSTDSRDIARRGLRMLERGDFAMARAKGERLTLRD